jgi:nucleoid DNA-binding protein
MDKPRSLSIKDYIIRKMSIKFNTSEKIIESVVNHQFQSATIAFNDQKSVELSGFGKFLFNEKKAVKKMETMLIQKQVLEQTIIDETATDRKRKAAEVKLESLLQAIEILKPKIQYESKSDIRGLEEQVDSPSSN